MILTLMRSGSLLGDKDIDLTPRDTQPYHQNMNLQEVFESYEERLRRVELRIKELFRNKVPFIPLIGDYIISSGGKRLRPLFHLISADLSGYDGDASHARGYEASFQVAQGTHPNFVIHAEALNSSGGAATAGTVGFNTDAAPLVISCPTQPATGSLKLSKSLTGGPGGYTGPFTIHYDCRRRLHRRR